MNRKKYQKIEDRLLEAQVTLENAMIDEVIAPAIAFYGFGVERMAESRALYRETFDMHRKLIAVLGDKFEATSVLHEALERADVVYRGAWVVTWLTRLPKQNPVRKKKRVRPGRPPKPVMTNSTSSIPGYRIYDLLPAMPWKTTRSISKNLE